MTDTITKTSEYEYVVQVFEHYANKSAPGGEQDLWRQVGSNIVGQTSRFGQSLALNEDGSFLVVGEPDYSDTHASLNSLSEGDIVGKVQVYKHDFKFDPPLDDIADLTKDWEQVGEDIWGEGYQDHFGHSVDISADGSIIVVGAPETEKFNQAYLGADETFDFNQKNLSGYVKVFQYDSTGGGDGSRFWPELGVPLKLDRTAGSSFGYSVSIDSEGTRIAVGYPTGDGEVVLSGGVDVYRYGEISLWVEITPVDGRTCCGNRADLVYPYNSEEFSDEIGAIYLGNAPTEDCELQFRDTSCDCENPEIVCGSMDDLISADASQGPHAVAPQNGEMRPDWVNVPCANLNSFNNTIIEIGDKTYTTKKHCVPIVQGSPQYLKLSPKQQQSIDLYLSAGYSETVDQEGNFETDNSLRKRPAHNYRIGVRRCGEHSMQAAVDAGSSLDSIWMNDRVGFEPGYMDPHSSNFNFGIHNYNVSSDSIYGGRSWHAPPRMLCYASHVATVSEGDDIEWTPCIAGDVTTYGEWELISNTGPESDSKLCCVDNSLTSSETILYGDFNGDGIVDALDYTIWKDNLHKDSSVLNGNGSGASVVVQADYELWKANFGKTLESSVKLFGDFNNDGVVDAADYTIWENNLGLDSAVLNGNGTGAATVVQEDYDLWVTHFGERRSDLVNTGAAAIIQGVSQVGDTYFGKAPSEECCPDCSKNEDCVAGLICKDGKWGPCSSGDECPGGTCRDGKCGDDDDIGPCCHGELNECSVTTKKRCDELDGTWGGDTARVKTSLKTKPPEDDITYPNWYRESACKDGMGIYEICRAVRDPNKTPVQIPVTYSFVRKGTTIIYSSRSTRKAHVLETNLINADEWKQDIATAFKAWSAAFKKLWPWVNVVFQDLGVEEKGAPNLDYRVGKRVGIRYRERYDLTQFPTVGDLRIARDFTIPPPNPQSVLAQAHLPWMNNEGIDIRLGQVGSNAGDMIFYSDATISLFGNKIYRAWRRDESLEPIDSKCNSKWKCFSNLHTIAHEMGHALGLRHIWGDAGRRVSGADMLTGFDGKVDIMPASSAHEFINVDLWASDHIYDAELGWGIINDDLKALKMVYEGLGTVLGNTIFQNGSSSSDSCDDCEPLGCCCKTSGESSEITTEADCVDGDWMSGEKCEDDNGESLCPECDDGSKPTCTEVHFKTFTIPDSIQVLCDGEVVCDTGMISTGNAFENVCTVTCCDPEFCVCAPLKGTRWELKLVDCDTKSAKKRIGGQGVDQCFKKNDEIPELPTGSCCHWDVNGNLVECDDNVTEADCYKKCQQGTPIEGENEDCGDIEEGELPPGVTEEGWCVWRENRTCSSSTCLACDCLYYGKPWSEVTCQDIKKEEQKYIWGSCTCGDCDGGPLGCEVLYIGGCFKDDDDVWYGTPKTGPPGMGDTCTSHLPWNCDKQDELVDVDGQPQPEGGVVPFIEPGEEVAPLPPGTEINQPEAGSSICWKCTPVALKVFWTCPLDGTAHNNEPTCNYSIIKEGETCDGYSTQDECKCACANAYTLPEEQSTEGCCCVYYDQSGYLYLHPGQSQRDQCFTGDMDVCSLFIKADTTAEYFSCYNVCPSTDTYTNDDGSYSSPCSQWVPKEIE